MSRDDVKHAWIAARNGGFSKDGLGRSKGGVTTKIHLIANAWGLPVRAEITGGDVTDYKGYDVPIDADLPAAKVLIVDRGYDSDHIRGDVEKRGGIAVIPGRANRKQPIPVDGFVYALCETR